MQRSLVLVIASLAISGLALAEPTRPSLIVKLYAEGPHAVGECAEWAFRQGRPLAPHTRDGSDSLDRLMGELGVHEVRALFRRSDGSPFQRQRERLATRLQNAANAARSSSRSGELKLPELAHVYVVEIESGNLGGLAIERLAGDPHVVSVQPNYSVDLDRSLDDPFLQSQGSWGQPYADQWGVYAVDAPGAWDHSLGAGVTIAVVDTGVDHEHPDIAPNLWVNPGEDLDGNQRVDPSDLNGIDDDGNGFVDDLRGYDFQDLDTDPNDESGHGTHVAGIAAARGDDAFGIAGIAPYATVMPVRVFPPSGPGDTATIWRGVLYAALNGADIVNGSFSCGTVCRDNPIAEEVVGILAELGVSYVTSAGNSSADVMLKSPERLRDSIVVGATQPSGALASFSSFGLLVDVVAPGFDILSLRAEAAENFYSPVRFVGDDHMRLNGTSMSAPLVAGVLALLKSRDPTLSPEDLRALLRSSALDLGETGHDARFGAGLVQPLAALDQSPPPDARGTIRAPLPGDTLSSLAEEFRIVGNASGADLRALRLELGAGSAPQEWESLTPHPENTTTFSADLPLRQLADGPHVIRLTLETVRGTAIQEFTPFSIDRDRPVLISDPGSDAQRPDVHGRRVVWVAPGARDLDSEGEPGSGLFTGRFGVRGQSSFADPAGDQTDPVISSVAAAWRDRNLPGFEALDAAVSACLGRRSCPTRELLSGPGERGRPTISGRRLVVREPGADGGQLRACLLPAPGGCNRDPIAPEVSNPREPLLDGSQLIWSGILDGFHLFQCRLGLDASCEPHRLDAPVFSPTLHALSQRQIAYSDFSLSAFAIELRVCAFDEATHSCDPIPVAIFSPGVPVTADLSEGRLVWHDLGAHGQLDVYLCEVDVERGRCPVQVLTNDAARQAYPRIQRSHVVWEDDRDGSSRIASLELPWLRPIRDAELQVGQSLSIPLRTRPIGASIEVSVQPPDGLPQGARIESGPANGSWNFRWRPTSDQVGVHELTFRATLPSGIHTERRARIQVTTPGPGSRPRDPLQ
jgi:subtilisin family serine protease